MRKAVAIDFDGCLCTDAYPAIGEPNWDVINRAKEEQQAGAGLILWTCREGQLLQEAVEACQGWGLVFDALNESLPDWIEKFDTKPRKVGASEYWDDRAVRIPKPPNPPLTLEELREMDSKGVWCRDYQCDGIVSVERYGRWADIPFLIFRDMGVDWHLQHCGPWAYNLPQEAGGAIMTTFLTVIATIAALLWLAGWRNLRYLCDPPLHQTM